MGFSAASRILPKQNGLTNAQGCGGGVHKKGVLAKAFFGGDEKGTNNSGCPTDLVQFAEPLLLVIDWPASDANSRKAAPDIA